VYVHGMLNQIGHPRVGNTLTIWVGKLPNLCPIFAV
jgi:hypothetical protein